MENEKLTRFEDECDIIFAKESQEGSIRPLYIAGTNLEKILSFYNPIDINLKGKISIIDSNLIPKEYYNCILMLVCNSGWRKRGNYVLERNLKLDRLCQVDSKFAETAGLIRDMVYQMLAFAGGNRKTAAELLDLTESRFSHYVSFVNECYPGFLDKYKENNYGKNKNIKHK